MSSRAYITGLFTVAKLSLWSLAAYAQVLPEDRADILYHSYDGGGVKITGPSILFRKQLSPEFSGYANYYVDSITSASIDVETRASEYTEERTEISFGGDYLLGDTILSAGYTHSDENDFNAKTAYFSVSQEVFGGLTTVSMGYSRGWDTVQRMVDGSVDPTFEEEVDRRAYRLGVSQVISKDFVTNFNFEVITDEGFLNNPYRDVRYRTAGGGVGWQSEVYPETRTSTAISAGGRYFREGGSAVYGNLRIFDDTWEIRAWNAQAGYTFSPEPGWLLDLSYRYYTQEAAEFYSDLFPFVDAQNFLARDKELSTFDSHSLRAGVSYDLPIDTWDLFNRGRLNFNYNYVLFEYEDFRDARDTSAPTADQQSLYDFSAGIFELYFSFWF